MMLFLLCVGLTLAGALKCRVETKNFDVSETSGEWHSVLLASDNMEKVEEGGSMRIFVEEMNVLQNNALFLKYLAKDNGTCSEFTMTCDSTENSGCFEVNYDGYNYFCIIETDYCNYLMFHLRNENPEEEDYQTMELYSRSPNASEILKRQFKEECKKRGIPEKNVLDLTLVDRCEYKRSDKAQSSSA